MTNRVKIMFNFRKNLNCCAPKTTNKEIKKEDIKSTNYTVKENKNEDVEIKDSSAEILKEHTEIPK